MKKLITIILILALLLPAAAPAEQQDPILGAWYIMLDYSEYPATAESAGKKYMLYIMIFEEDGTISGISGESLETTGLYANGSAIGTWQNNGGAYTVNMIGVGSNAAEFSGDRLLVQMTGNVWYSMQRMNWGGWYTDLVFRY